MEFHPVLPVSCCKLPNFHFTSCPPKDIRMQRSFSWCSCEKSTEVNNSLDIWLGRIAMLIFAAVITIEISTGKGVLQKQWLVASQSVMITGFSRPAQVAGVGKCSTAVKLSSFGATLSSFTAKYRLNTLSKAGDKRIFSALNTRVAVKVQSTGQEIGNLKREEVPRVALICGGPSAERGISLNLARSVLGHIQAENLSVSCYYIDCQINAYAISSAQMYSTLRQILISNMEKSIYQDQALHRGMPKFPLNREKLLEQILWVL